MHSLTESEIFEKFGTSKLGLSNKQAETLLKTYGKNELNKTKKQSFVKSFLKQFLNIMVMILLVSAIISLSIAVINKNYSDLFEGFIILFIVVVNAFIGVIQESKAQACLEDMEKFTKTNVKVLRSNAEIWIDSSLLVPGDIVFLEAGNVVKADLRLIETNNFACDESSLTGESVPSEKSASLVLPKKTALADKNNMAFSGSMVIRGKAKGVVVATGNNTEIGKIANILFNAKKETTPLQKAISNIGKILTIVVLVVCAVIMIIELLTGNNFINALMISVALAVAAIPESLPAVITIILALGVQQLAKRKSIIKHLNAVETLGCCEIICSDKTGTLTQNKIKVVETYSDGSINKFEGFVFEKLIDCMLNCNDAKFENDKIIGEPTETALLEFASKFKQEKKKVVHEIPFNSTRKMMSVFTNEKGIVSYTKGAPEFILKRCKYFFNGEKVEILTEEKIKEIKNIYNQMTEKAFRVMGFAYKKFDFFNPNVNVENDMVFVGLCGMMDKPRLEVKESIDKCFKAGLTPVMITGDHKKTAFRIALELGIAKDVSEVITGEEIDELTDKELSKICKNYKVYARVTPEHKVRIVQAFKNLKKVVAMTGDGVNDAPSLKIADIGVGMGKSGTDVVKNVADMVITDDNFSSIVVAVEEGRKVYSNIQKALQFLISTNCVEVFGMLFALLFFPKIEFLSAAQMLFINLVTDSLPAFALGTEKVEKEIMNEPPREVKKSVFAGKIGISIIYQSILQTLIVMVVFVLGIYCYNPKVASTMVFFTIIFMQTLHSVNCKTNNSLLDKNLIDNKTFNICFLVTMGINLIVACVPFMYNLFGLKFLNFSQWITVIIASVLIIPLCEIIKMIINSDLNNKIKIKNKKVLKNINS